MTVDPLCGVCGGGPCCHGEQSDVELMELTALQANILRLQEELRVQEDKLHAQRLRAEIAETVTGGLNVELRGLREAAVEVLLCFGSSDIEALRRALHELHKRVRR